MFKKAGFASAILALSGFYLYTLYLAAHPQVSLSYRLYYMEGKTQFWEHNSDLVYHTGNQLDLAKPSRFLSSEGWASKPTAQGTQLQGEGGLYFVLSKQPDALTVLAKVDSPKAGTLLKVALGHDWTTTIKLAKQGLNEVKLNLPGNLLKADPSQPNFLAISTPEPLNFHTVQMKVAQ
ncbi:hypothetical protein [Aeromonas simiae]|uniref:hypothetical protein n=1 Tax=Aeromonas simiae TaxID=218936 RepID=UPI0005A5EE29|nr:hypothetical protein [Aeromonas simiae]MDO2947534.1 hypothetical protein [Aeromonas simiae]MDO2951625.1 hypothetical protein [Aeromonas simiae]MDO2955094.1 hypothetical protein [Aeromonas simiae]